jgi:murein DD-endopeptidase MepM/ murein hydrolase activator NlpD
MRTVLLSIALALAAVAVTAGRVSAQIGDGLGGARVDLPGGGGVELPGPGGGGGVDLPGGGGVHLPGSGNGGGSVESPGGGSVPLPDGGGGGGVLPAPPSGGELPPAPDDGSASPPPDDGSSGPGGRGGRGSGSSDRGGNGGEGGDRASADEEHDGQRVREPDIRNPDGTPTPQNPTLTVADFGPAPIGVPNFLIDQFTIPPFLLPIYQACGTQYSIPWQVLASINRIETAFGTNLNVSSAGALGWMQFMPQTWRAYGVDANDDGRRDPYNPVDAICAAARYLNAAGGAEDLRGAIFAYNHADWYVDEVLLYARQYGRLPDDLVGSLTGLTEGARFPVAADARYADDLSEREALARAKPGQRGAGNAADVVTSSPTRRGINIYARSGAPVVAVNDGVVKRIGHSRRLGRYLILEDAYGNRFTYAELGRVARVYPVPEEHRRVAASDYRAPHGGARPDPVDTEASGRRLFAYPERQLGFRSSAAMAPVDQMLDGAGMESFRSQFGALDFDPKRMNLRSLDEGSKVVAGTVLGRIGKTDELAPHLNFAIRPAGRGAPKIDPKPILDGWKLLEATHLYRAGGKDPFAGNPTSAQVLLLSKEQATRELLTSPGVDIYECGRTDVRAGQIDVRVMKVLLYLVARGYDLTVTSLKCGHSTYTTSGSVSEHSTGNAVDIAMIDGQPVLGNQGPGTLAYSLVQDVLRLQGSMQPHQVISLMNLGGPSFAMADHDDHVHIGYQPVYGDAIDTGDQFAEILAPDQWRRLIGRISQIDNPAVRSTPSRFAIPDRREQARPASPAHAGE